jgi:hypothetical protein
LRIPRLPILIATMLALTAPVVVPAATAAPAKISVDVGSGSVAAGETYVVKGRVSPALRRAMKVQAQRGKRWVTVAKGRSTKRGTYSVKVAAPTAPATLKVRTLAPATQVGGRRLPRVVSATRTVRVYARSTAVTASAPSALFTGESLAVSVTVSPASTRAVQLQELVGGSWRAVADAWTLPGGVASLLTTPATGQHTYRAHVPASGAWAAASSAPMMVDVRPAAAPTSRLQVLVTGLPAGVAADVSLTAPDGQVRELTASETLERAALGAWSVSAAPVVVATDTFHPVEQTITTTVTQGQAATLVVDYGVILPETTSVVPTPAIESVTDLGNGIYEISLTSAVMPTRDSPALARREQRQQDFVAEAGIGPAQASSECFQWAWGVVCEGNVFVSGVSAGAPGGAFGRVQSLANPLKFKIDRTGVTLADAIPFGVSKKQVSPTIERTAKFKTRALTCSGQTSAELKAELEMTPSLESEIRFAGGELQSASIVARLDQRAAATATLQGKGTCSTAEFDVAPEVTLPAVWVTFGPAHVVFVPTLTLTARADARIDGTATVNLSETASAQAGIKYSREKQFHPEWSYEEPRTTMTGPSFDGSASASVTLPANLEFRLYGAPVGPSLTAEASLTGEANAKASPSGATLDWTLDASLHAYGQFRVDVLGFKEESQKLTFWKQSVNVAEGSWSWNPPSGYLPEITTTTLPRARGATPYDVRMTTSDNRPGRWGVASGALPPGLELDPDSGRLWGATPGAGSWTFTVSFVDGYGSSTSRPLTLESDPVPDDLLPDAFTGLPDVPAYDVVVPVAAEHGGTWEVVDPSQLPANLTFEPTGRLHGRYPSSGQYQFTVRNTGTGLTHAYRLSAVRLEMSQNCAYRMDYTSIFVNMGWPDSGGNHPHHVVLTLDGEVVTDTTTQPGGGFVKLWDDLAVSRPYDVSLTVDGVVHSFRALCP